MGKALELSAQTFEQEVIKSDKPVLVDFWAPWCGPCRMMAPVIDELSDEMAGKIKIAKLDVEVEAHRDLAMQYQIQSIPCMKIFKDGQVIRTIIGYHDKETLKGEIEVLL